VALFHVLEKEEAWRKSVGKASYGALNAFKPLVAIGAAHPLEEEELAADHFHGADGLHNVHDTVSYCFTVIKRLALATNQAQHPHLSPAETWKALFPLTAAGQTEPVDPQTYSTYFTPCKTVAHKEMLRILKENPEDTVTIVALGPMTNVALAAAEDPETFLRVKELVVMGGAVHCEGNITPCAEFNTYADAIATARVFALTSPNPASTMPPTLNKEMQLPPYPAKLSRRLKLTLFPLDVTTPHELRRQSFTEQIQKHMAAGSPLAQWAGHFILKAFDKIDSILGDGSEAALSLHDPLTVWYMLHRDDPNWKRTPKLEDIRIETTGQWTRGMHVIDRRGHAKPGDDHESLLIQTHPKDTMDSVTFNDFEIDTKDWMSRDKGNRITRMVESPGLEVVPQDLMKRIFG
jgi:inosine-uridine nucleoside N-ribohydrolase